MAREQSNEGMQCEKCEGLYGGDWCPYCEIERLEAELELAIGLIHDKERVMYGWNPGLWRHGYYIDGKWAGARLEDAICEAVKEK